MRPRTPGLQPREERQPTPLGQLEIQQQEIWAEGFHEAQPLGAISRFADDLEVLLRRQDQAESGPEEGGLDSDEHGNWGYEVLKGSVKQ